jgi:hypothetical protein
MQKSKGKRKRLKKLRPRRLSSASQTNPKRRKLLRK